MIGAASLPPMIRPNQKGRTPRGVRPFVLIRARALDLIALLRHRGRTLLRHLAADFTAGIGRGMDVDVILAGHQVGGLGVRQGGAAFGRA